MKRFLLILIALLSALSLGAQVYNMPANGHMELRGSHFEIYDDGGPNVPYSQSSHGSITLRPATPGSRWRIHVQHAIIHSSYISRLTILEGDSASTRWVFNNNGGYAIVGPYQYHYLLYANDTVVTIRFDSDDESPTAGFRIVADEVGCSDCRPGYISTSCRDTNSATQTGTLCLSWSGSYWGAGTACRNQAFMVVYYNNHYYNGSAEGEWGVTLSSGTHAIDTLYVDTAYCEIPGYHYGDYYYVDIKPLCGDSARGGMGLLDYVVWSPPVTCDCVYPSGLNYSWADDTMHITWFANSQVATWGIQCYEFNIDTIITENHYELPWPDSLRCHSTSFYVSGNCDFLNGNYPCRSDWIYPGHYSCSNVGYRDYYHYTGYYSGWFSEYVFLISAGPHSLTVGWADADTLSGNRYVVRCLKPLDRWNTRFDTVAVDTVARGVCRYTFSGLEENCRYRVSVGTLCADGYNSCSVATEEYHTTLDNCLDYVNFADEEHVHLSVGTYNNPYWDTLFFYDALVLPYGHPQYSTRTERFFYDLFPDRHAVIRDTTEYDSRTGYLLRKVPQGKKASVMLGNDNIGAEAESITYDYYVDSTVNDLLVLKYAIVMQNPNHTLSNQPHFTLELLDEQGRLMDSTCCYADFYAADNLEGWNYVSGTNRLWKDWTTIGINIAPYHGQHIKVRLTNKDCAEGGHWAYSYFTIHCDNRRICLYNFCDVIQYVHLRAPEGFEYEWTNPGSPTILSTEQDAIVPANDSSLYLCKCSFIGKPQCYFTMETYVTDIYPVAEADWWIDTCRQLATFVNRSYVWFDTTHEYCIPQDINLFYWLYQGDTLWDDTLRLSLEENRDYTIRLEAHLSDSPCSDGKGTDFPINFVTRRRIAGDSVVCLGDTLRLALEMDTEMPRTYWWSTGATTQSITLVPGVGDTLFRAAYYDGTCADTLQHRLLIHPFYDDTLHVEACQGYQFDSLGFHEDKTGRYTFHKLSRQHCDSLFTLDLLIHPVYHDTMRVATCDAPWRGYDSTGRYLEEYRTLFGCDSTVLIDLTRRTAEIWGDTMACEGSEVRLHATDLTAEGAQYYWQVGRYTPDIAVPAEARRAPYLLDIVVNDTCAYHLSHPLTVNPLYDDTIVANICQGIYDTLGFHESETGRYTQRLSSQFGCDSLSTLDLTRRPSYYDTLVIRTCDLPYTDGEWDEELSGFYTHTYQTALYLCDSILSLDFTRWPVFTDTIREEIFFGDTYVGYGFRETEEGFYQITLADNHSCDSTYRLDLTVIDLRFPNAVTPNGDHVNDRFVIHDLARSERLEHFTLHIYDRNGRLVFKQIDDPSEAASWDPNQTNSPTGTYFYHFQGRALSKSIERNGVIEVLR